MTLALVKISRFHAFYNTMQLAIFSLFNFYLDTIGQISQILRLAHPKNGFTDP